MFSGELPKMDNSAHHGDKLHQVFVNTKLTLEHILDGYSLPDPYFKDHLQATVDILMKCLRDPALPLFELQVKYLVAAWKNSSISRSEQLCNILRQ